MKIGILTFHRAINYGAVLQAYALQEVLKEMGHNVSIIDYRPLAIEKERMILSLYHFFSESNLPLTDRLKLLIGRIFSLFSRQKAIREFDIFLSSRLNVSPQVIGNKIPMKYDCYIFGSDQIWNPRILNGFDNVYLGQFPVDKGSVKVAYAASMGNESKLSATDFHEFISKLKVFNKIGVRELSLKEYISPDIQSNLVLDPTLLSKCSIFDKIAVKPMIKEKYVLLFALEKDPLMVDFAKHIALQLDAKVIRLIPSHIKFKKESTEYVSAVSPAEFCGWFKYAACIVGISYHATAFSIIYRKNFYCLKSFMQDRTRNVLRLLYLESRLVSSSDKIEFTPVDYNKANNQLTKLQEESMFFLTKAIEHEK